MPQLTVQNIPQLIPEAMAEYNRVKAAGDPRTWEQWAAGHMRVDPNWLNSLNSYYANRTTNEARQVTTMPEFQGLSPEMQATLAQRVRDNGLARAAELTADELNGKDLSDPANLALAQWVAKSAPGTFELSNTFEDEVPLEQGLLDTALNEYILPDLERDRLRRGETQAGVDDINRTLDDALALNRTLIGTGLDEKAYLTAHPDVAQAYDGLYKDAQGRAMVPTLDGRVVPMSRAEFAKYHYDNWGKYEEREAPTRESERLIQERTQADVTAGAQLETLEEAIARRTAALDIETATVGTAIDKLEGERRAILEQQKTETDAAIAARNDARLKAIDAETAQLNTALGALDTERRAAMAPLEAERVAAARTLSAGVNQGLETERDRLAAAMAEKGYVGSSTFEEAALARAALEARQKSAETMAQATLANATDRRGIGEDTAQGRFSISSRDATGRRGAADETSTSRFDLGKFAADTGAAIGNTARSDQFGLTVSDAAARRALADFAADEGRGVKDQATLAKQAYFDADLGRGLEAALRAASLGEKRLDLADRADQAGYTGLNRALDTLNWWSASPSMPRSTPGVTQPSNMGADIAGLGAGLTSGAFSLAASQWANRNKTPTTTKPAGTAYGDMAAAMNNLYKK